MASRIENPNGEKLNWLKWSFVVFLVGGGMVANYYFSQQPWPLRLVGWLLLFMVAGVVAAQTVQGKQLLTFARESRNELRKVVWPTRQETIQMTMIIVAVVFILGLLLWGIDGILLRVIGWLTGQRG